MQSKRVACGNGFDSETSLIEMLVKCQGCADIELSQHDEGDAIGASGWWPLHDFDRFLAPAPEDSWCQ